MSLFLGVFGIHKFLIGKHKSGLIRLLFLVVSILIFTISGFEISFFLILIVVAINMGLRISDFAIGIFMVSDASGKVYF